MTNTNLMNSFLIILLCTLLPHLAAAQSESELLQQLRADYYSLIDAMEEYELAGETYKMSASEKQDYYNWISQLREQFTQTCYIFSRQPNLEGSADVPCAEYVSSYTMPVNIDIEHESTGTEKTAAIADQFNDSLGDFDEKLLREQDRVKAMRPQNTSAQSGGGGGAGAGDSGDGDGDSSGEGEAGADEQAGQESDQRSGQQSGQQSDQQGEGRNDSGAGGRPRPGKRGDVPDDVSDGSDDDVVARQLREAAENETDPELREKLWDEYRRYKKGQ